MRSPAAATRRRLRAFRPPSAAVEHWPDFVETISTLHLSAAGWPAELDLACRWYAPHMERRYEDAAHREADLTQLAQIAASYPTRERFLTELTLDPPDATSDEAGVPLLDEDWGHACTHPIRGDELRALRRLQREQVPSSPFVFTSERGSPFTTAGFARMIERAGETAKLGFKAHPHMLRHATGYALANAGHDTRALQSYLGHRNIQHTVKYTELAPTRFRDFFR